MNIAMYACVYAREFPAQALLRLRPELQRKAVAVLEGEPPREFVCSANTHGYAIGVQRGMTRPQMEVLENLEILRRSRAEEQSARDALLECVGRFSPRVEELRFENALGFGTDLSGTEKLLGTAKNIVANLFRQAQAIGLEISVAASCNLHAALCWAKSHIGTKVIGSGEERKILAPIPVDALDLTLDQSVTFSLWGIHTLGALAALPQTELVARLGQEGKRLHQLAWGEHPHLLKPVTQEFELKEAIEFEAGVESLDSVMFVLSPMLQQLCVRADSRALALVSVTVQCELDGGALYSRTLRPVLPTIDHAALLKLIHLDLIANPPGAAVMGIRALAETNRPSRAQLGLFSPQFPEPMRLEVTLARLAAVVGSTERVGAPELLDSHHRDAFRVRHFAAPEEAKTKTAVAPARVGLRVLRPAEAVYVQTYKERPHQFVFRGEQYMVGECYGPWHSSGDWWGPERWARAQWDVVASSRTGKPLCCQLSCEAASNAWQVEALYD
jgi:protein ImuB